MEPYYVSSSPVKVTTEECFEVPVSQRMNFERLSTTRLASVAVHPTDVALQWKSRSPNQVQCAECGKVLNVKNLKRHFQATHQGTLFPCDICNRVYNRYDNLRKHFLEKHGAGPKLECPFCRKIFKRKVIFDHHLLECRSENA